MNLGLCSCVLLSRANLIWSIFTYDIHLPKMIMIMSHVKRNFSHCLFVLFVKPTSPQWRRMPSIPYGLQDTSLSHCFGILRVDKTSTGFSIESGYPSIESSLLITRQGKLCNNCLMLSHASVCSHHGAGAAAGCCQLIFTAA